MKSLVILLLITLSISKINSGLRGTPQASDFNDQFGTDIKNGI